MPEWELLRRRLKKKSYQLRNWFWREGKYSITFCLCLGGLAVIGSLSGVYIAIILYVLSRGL